MTLGQQYALDLFRAAQHGTPPPPAPGTADAAVLRDVWNGLRGLLRRRHSDRPHRTEPAARA